MSEPRTILRFTWSERIYHWAQALPFLTLLVTGGWMLARTVGRPPAHVQDGWVVVHKTAGVLLGVLPFLAALAGHWPSLWENVRAAVRWGRSDLRWIAAVAVRLVRPERPLPPVGKFNPGQKLNFLATLVLMPALAGSGLVMWCIKGALWAWVVHVGLALMAMVLVAGHVYMAVLNRATRHSLRAMVVGTVDLDWARHHHGAWVSASGGAPDPSVHRAPPVHWPAVLGRVAILAVGLAILVSGTVWLGLRFGQKIRQGLARPERFLKPGELTRVHEADARLRHDCFQCHDLAEGVSERKCLNCHGAIADRRAAGVGFHGTLTGPCIACHPEHRGQAFDIVRLDGRTFNHDLAQFPLEGAHRRLDCGRCHDRPAPGASQGRRTYIGLAHGRCQDCHEDPHAGQLGADCRRCHTMDAWTGRALHFAHDLDTAFPLRGGHSRVPCEKCHERAAGRPLAAARFTGQPSDCAGCHADPHVGQFQTVACTACHSVEGWKGSALLFRHDTHSDFRLDALHARLACASCHTAGRYRPLPRTCADCHEDIRRMMAGRFPRPEDRGVPSFHDGLVACTDCHEPAEGRPSALEYARRCTACHNDHYAGLLTAWQSAAMDRVLKIQRLLQQAEQAGTRTPEQLQSLRKELDQWRRIGSHNVELQLQRLDDLARRLEP